MCDGNVIWIWFGVYVEFLLYNLRIWELVFKYYVILILNFKKEWFIKESWRVLKRNLYKKVFLLDCCVNFL